MHATRSPLDAITKKVDGGFELHGPITPIPKLLRDVVRSRGLIRMLSKRDFYVRFRRPTFGILWALALPLMNAIVLSVVFTLVVKIRTPHDYPTFVMSGVLPWIFFATTTATACTSITSASSITSKVYFPRAILPLVTMLANFYGFLPGLGLLIGLAAVRGVPLGPTLLLLVPAVLFMLVITASFSLVFAALQVYYRDVSFIVQASLQAWFYASAVFFPLTRVPEGILRSLIQLNPTAGMIQLFRAALFGDAIAPLSIVGLVAWPLVLATTAALIYRRFDRVFVDLL
jgi:lipopolysaccharide transport system permease protein